MITLGQNSGWFNAPNAAYDRVTGYQPGERCARRDLPLDLYRAHARQGHPPDALLAMPDAERRHPRAESLGPAQGPKDQPLDLAFAKQSATVIHEWSARYGDKVSGWWFDGGYAHIRFNEEIASRYADAVKRGNPKAIVTFNPGVSLKRHTPGRGLHGGRAERSFRGGAGLALGERLAVARVDVYSAQPGANATCDSRRSAGASGSQKVAAQGGVVTLDMGRIGAQKRALSSPSLRPRRSSSRRWRGRSERLVGYGHFYQGRYLQRGRRNRNRVRGGRGRSFQPVFHWYKPGWGRRTSDGRDALEMALRLATELFAGAATRTHSATGCPSDSTPSAAMVRKCPPSRQTPPWTLPVVSQ